MSWLPPGRVGARAGDGDLWVMCFSTQASYKWLARASSDTYLINAAMCVYADDLGLGYRFIADDLVHAGVAASETRSKHWSASQQTGRAI